MTALNLGPEAELIDSYLLHRQRLPTQSRDAVWASVESILAHGGKVAAGESRMATGVAVGYVQSGKTTSFTALIGAAVDQGYRVIVAMLGSTSLLLSQNRDRLKDALALDVRRDYKWIHLENPSLRDTSPTEVARYLDRGRRVLITVLKHHSRIEDAARVLDTETARRALALVVDDEADQVSLNTLVREGEESRTYAAVRHLRAALGPHLYVQYTATPYAPLLLAAEDFLSPDFVTLLDPGEGYVGGYEFLVEERARVVRIIGDSPGPAQAPTRIPPSLGEALVDFLVGCALLLGDRIENAPVSMLIHPTGRTEPQRRYEVLVDHLVRGWQRQLEAGSLGEEFASARSRLVAAGCPDIGNAEFAAALRMTLAEATLWRINSDEDANAHVQWNLSPVHILIGGNKLSRGFTIEGLTVSWLGRAPSAQLDTLVQRARAYGYRRPYLPFCRIYAAAETVDGLTAAVATDLDMRSQLRDWLERRLPIRDWGTEVGLSIGPGFSPSRKEVLDRLAEFRPGWHLMSKPDLEPDAERENLRLIDAIGLRQAEVRGFGRLEHRYLGDVDAVRLRDLIERWRVTFSPGWDRDGILAWLNRQVLRRSRLPVLYLSGDRSAPRSRAWDERLGFVQLMQGRDVVMSEGAYPGDRDLLGGASQLQVHYVRPRGGGPAVHTLALHVSSPGRLVRRASRDR